MRVEDIKEKNERDDSRNDFTQNKFIAVCCLRFECKKYFFEKSPLSFIFTHYSFSYPNIQP